MIPFNADAGKGMFLKNDVFPKKRDTASVSANVYKGNYAAVFCDFE